MTPKGPTVYIVYNDRRKDLSAAEKFGQLRDMFYGRVNYERAVEHARKMLHDFNAETDYLLVIGDPALVGVVMSVALEYANDESITVLRWNRDELEYMPQTFNFAEGEADTAPAVVTFKN